LREDQIYNLLIDNGYTQVSFLKHDPYASLRNPEFRNYVIARLVLTIGSLMQAVIVGWQVYELTKDPFSLGLIGLAEAIPSIGVSLYAGYLTDKLNRKYVLLFSYSLLLLCALFLALISAGDVSSFIPNKVFAIYAAIFLSGIARGFAQPSAFAFLSQLVEPALFPNAVTWNSSIWQVGAVTGPAIAGFIYSFAGFTYSYLLISVFIFTGVILISFIKKKPLPVRKKELPMIQSLTAGVKFVFNNKIILSAISLDLFAVLFGGATALLPIFSDEILRTGPQGLGILRAAPSIGAVVMTFVMTRKPPTYNAGRKLLVCVFSYGITMLVFAVSQSFYLSVCMLALGGAFDSVSVVIRATIMQLMTPEEMKGRASSVNAIFIGSSNEIGAFESGVAAKFMGTVPSVIFGASMTLIVVFIVSFLSPKLRKLNL
jgi:MFS family permease